MSRLIDYYFSLISPFSYLGHQTLLNIAAKHGATVAFKPMTLPDVFKTSGTLPIPERPASRQAYRLIELQRIADYRQLPLTLRPKHFPTNPSLANAAVAAITATGKSPEHFMFAVFQALWVHEQDISEDAVIRTLLSADGLDASEILDSAGSQPIEDQIAENTKAAIAAGAVGAPVYVLDGEPFWGQDRLEYLDQALTSGRGPYTSD